MQFDHLSLIVWAASHIVWKASSQGFTAMPNPISLPTTLMRGFSMRCPNCGRGHLFGRFLKVADHCETCGEDFTPQRADDFPAYLVIIVVGHLVVPTLLAVEIAYAPPVWLQLLIWLPVTVFAALALLQPTKGAIVALQWQTRMHGFEESRARRSNKCAAISGKASHAF
jgi:uncharacterized protein (DUF983 family)